MTSARAALAQVLQSTWGFSRFRPLQLEAMEAIMAGEDSIVILPTGGGKSLCFQAPALALPGVAIVVSPLISLMKDQVDALREVGVPAGKLHSGQPPEESRQVSAALRAGELKLLYVSPERLVLEGFSGVVRGAEVSFLAVDEAHCVSEWGHDFRPEYRQLQGFRAAFPRASLHAYTATATPRVAQDIEVQLGLRTPRRLCGSFDRHNLFYRVERRDRATDQILRVARRHAGESGIVYCISRKEAERIAEELSSAGLPARAYHAGLPPQERARNQEAFINDEVALMVATIAFGMGIDKPDVRFVVHAGMPKSLEHYQQESGRAGRDGLAAECVLLHSPGDMVKWDVILGEQPPDVRRQAKDKLRAVEGYCGAWACRRAALLDYFGEEYPATNCAGCDVCAGTLSPIAESLVTAQKVLSCVKRLNEAEGARYVASVLVADEGERRIVELGHDRLSTHGLLRGSERGLVEDWIRQLVLQGHLVQGRGEEGPLRVTPRGWEVLRGGPAPRLLGPAPPTPARSAGVAAAGSADEWEGVHRPLFDVLRALRAELAKERGVPPYVVFGDRTLRELARYRPTEPALMRRLHGIGNAKMEHFGELFLGAIRRYLRENPSLPANLEPAAAEPATREEAPPSPRSRPTQSGGASPARAEALRLLREGNAPQAVAEAINRAPSTVEEYLTELIEKEAITDATPWVPAAVVEAIEGAVEGEEPTRLRPIWEKLGGTVPYWQIRVVLACRRQQA